MALRALIAFIWAECYSSDLGGRNWYDDIESIAVFSPKEAEAAKKLLDVHYREMLQDEFSSKRFAVLLKSGHYPELAIGVPFYTSIAGVGLRPGDVQVDSFHSESRLPSYQGGATKTFWRSVEGLTTTNATSGCTWATSQACPIRRTTVAGDLRLSGPWFNETWDGASSGGFISDTTVKGTVRLGTQSQFMFRNAKFGGVSSHAMNTVLVGVDGPFKIKKSENQTVIERAPLIAEKPFLHEHAGQWYVIVPPLTSETSGTFSEEDKLVYIRMENIHVARATDTAAMIHKSIVGKKGLLLTPGVYSLDSPILIDQPGFIVLGIGFATLVATSGQSALAILASDVRVASVLVEGGSPTSNFSSTQPLISWKGDHGMASDIFARVGTFGHNGCVNMTASIFLQVEGHGVVLDHAWLWHADHDDCSEDRWPDSNSALGSFSQNGLVAKGNHLTVYGLQSEHTFGDQVKWSGEHGRLFFFQSELPYINPYAAQGFNFGDRYVGYRVSNRVRHHFAVGLGLYLISIPNHTFVCNVTAFAFSSSAHFENIFIWHITGARTPFYKNLVCMENECIPCRVNKTCGDFSSDNKSAYMWTRRAPHGGELQGERGKPEELLMEAPLHFVSLGERNKGDFPTLWPVSAVPINLCLAVMVTGFLVFALSMRNWLPWRITGGTITAGYQLQLLQPVQQAATRLDYDIVDTT